MKSARSEQLVTENINLIYLVMKRFRNRGIENDDLFQIGAVGLMKAAERFDEGVALVGLVFESDHIGIPMLHDLPVFNFVNAVVEEKLFFLFNQEVSDCGVGFFDALEFV